MHFFLVNDDGIEAKGLLALATEIAGRGHKLTVCAPYAQQSAASHRITLADPIFVEERGIPGAKAWAISGTPADCVRVGLGCLADAPVDVLVSGINNGYNAGMAVHYSGTVGAAMEGALNRIPSVATSIHHKGTNAMIAHLARYTVDMAERYAACERPACAVLNINAPLREPDDLLPPVYAPLDRANFVDGYERRQSPRAGMYFWLVEGGAMEERNPGSDMDYLERGHITLTLLGNPECIDFTLPEQG